MRKASKGYLTLGEGESTGHSGKSFSSNENIGKRNGTVDQPTMKMPLSGTVGDVSPEKRVTVGLGSDCKLTL